MFLNYLTIILLSQVNLSLIKQQIYCVYSLFLIDLCQHIQFEGYMLRRRSVNEQTCKFNTAFRNNRSTGLDYPEDGPGETDPGVLSFKEILSFRSR